MIDLLGGLARWLSLGCGLLLPGLGVWALLGPTETSLRRCGGLLTVAGTLALGLLLATQTAAATGRSADLWQLAAWLAYVEDTHAGRALGWRLLALLAAGGLLQLAARLPPGRSLLLAGSLMALLSLCGAVFSGHAASLGGAWLAVHALHLATASLWLGGLYLLCALPPEARHTLPARLQRFSGLALPLMGLTLASGLTLAYGFLATQFAGLVASVWGAWLLLKLLLVAGVLGIAARLRWSALPRLRRAQDSADATPLLRQLRLEFALALALLGAAAGLGLSPPGGHIEISQWPWPFRFTLDGTLPEPGTLGTLTAGGALLILGIAALARRGGLALTRTGGALGALGTAVMLYALAVPASPDTYRRPSIAFDALSIANGATHYAAHCVACHGAQGRGDGPLAAGLPRRPVDLLTEPHTARHTAGDFYHWLLAGIPESGMPAFAQTLDEDARWDVVNFLHALNRGYEARILQPRVMPGQPQARLVAPDFSWRTRDGQAGWLTDWRGSRSVLLVFYRLPASAARLAALSRADWGAAPPAVLAIPLDGQSGTGLPFEVVDNAAAIAGAYGLFRRTLGNPDLFGNGTPPDHLELLIDRFGYLRARWMPAEEGGESVASAEWRGELARLADEPQILPPADAHVH